MASTIRTAIATRLKATPGLVALLGTPTAVYHRKAPQPVRPPVVVYDKRSGSTDWAFGKEAFTTEYWTVRGIAFGRTADRAEDIAAQIDLALNDAPLVLTGRTLLMCRKDTDVDFPEQVGKEMFQHTGGVYKIITAPP